MPKSIYFSGSAFQDNDINNTRPINRIKGRDRTNYVALTRWCRENNVSIKVGRTLIKRKLLIGTRLLGRWWVCANLDCYELLLDYLGVEAIIFDADNFIE